MPQPNVLLVEDDRLVRNLVAEYLRSEGMSVAEASSLASAKEALNLQRPDVAVVDLMLGDGSGLDLIREIGDMGPGIIVLSARGSPVDRILGLELGAHDYLNKPVEPRELALRIRRLAGLVGAAKAGRTDGEILVFRDFELDTVLRRLAHKERGPVELTGTQYRLLELFVRNPNRVFERDTLMEQVFDRQWVGLSRSIDVLVSKTRTKIDAPGEPTLIKSIRGVGYVFAADVRRRRRE
jgi:DNA-binding response OmpR family regulator